MEHEKNNEFVTCENELKDEFVTCENELKDEFDEKRNKRFAKILGIDKFYMKNMSNVMKYYHVEIDGHIVDKIYIDEYNNLSCKIPYLIPIHYLSLFRKFFNEYLENEDTYYHRSGTSFFINYFKKFYNHLIVPQVQEMCDIDDIECENLERGCFRSWLITDSYCCKKGGNLINDYEIKKLGWNPDLFER